MLLLMDGTLMRGDDARRIQLCDMFCHPVEQLRPHAGFALGTVTDQGKVNRVSRGFATPPPRPLLPPPTHPMMCCCSLSKAVTAKLTLSTGVIAEWA